MMGTCRAWLPVTDFEYILGPPSTELPRGQLNGVNLLVGVRLFLKRDI